MLNPTSLFCLFYTFSWDCSSVCYNRPLCISTHLGINTSKIGGMSSSGPTIHFYSPSNSLSCQTKDTSPSTPYSPSLLKSLLPNTVLLHTLTVLLSLGVHQLLRSISISLREAHHQACSFLHNIKHPYNWYIFFRVKLIFYSIISLRTKEKIKNKIQSTQ